MTIREVNEVDELRGYVKVLHGKILRITSSLNTVLALGPIKLTGYTDMHPVIDHESGKLSIVGMSQKARVPIKLSVTEYMKMKGEIQ